MEEDSAAVNAHIGRRIRLLRRMKRIGMRELAEAAGVTYQQLQKYERGANRISAARLHRLSIFLNVPPGFFFDGLPEAEAGSADRTEILEMAAYCSRVPPKLRKCVVEVLKALSRAGSAGGDRPGRDDHLESSPASSAFQQAALMG